MNRESQVMVNEDACRKSTLYENFGDICSNQTHPQLADLSIDKSKMLDFFGFSGRR